jgi:hypothetical protein
MDEKDINEVINSALYILQDIQAIRSNKQNLGKFSKVNVRNDHYHYEIGLGSSMIKINKYKSE